MRLLFDTVVYVSIIVLFSLDINHFQILSSYISSFIKGSDVEWDFICPFRSEKGNTLTSDVMLRKSLKRASVKMGIL